MRVLCVLAFALTLLNSIALAQTSQKTFTYNYGGWNPEVRRHAERSYVAFEKFAREIEKTKLKNGDYYYSFTVVPEFRLTFEDCESREDWALDLIRGFFGTTESRFAVVRASISHRYGPGLRNDIVKDAVLLAVGQGIDPITNQEGNGCFFDNPGEIRTPLVRYRGADPGQSYDDFDIKFFVSEGAKINLNAVSNIKELVTAFSAAWNWSDLSGKRTEAIATAGEKLQKAIGATSYRNAKRYQAWLEATGEDKARLTVRLPRDIDSKAGYLVIYSRVSASAFLDGGDIEITPRAVITNEFLGSRKCIALNEKDSCNALRSFIDGYRADQAKDAPPYILSTAKSAQGSIYTTCQNIRNYATGTLWLSTLDALLVRWAATKGSGIQEALSNEQTLKSIAIASEKTPAEIVHECWNEHDENRLQQVVQSMNKKLLPNDDR